MQQKRKWDVADTEGFCRLSTFAWGFTYWVISSRDKNTHTRCIRKHSMDDLLMRLGGCIDDKHDFPPRPMVFLINNSWKRDSALSTKRTTSRNLITTPAFTLTTATPSCHTPTQLLDMSKEQGGLHSSAMTIFSLLDQVQ
ncbi:hypothetical protein DMENIID0001_094780 [Sergentomyia squamirostris]